MRGAFKLLGLIAAALLVYSGGSLVYLSGYNDGLSEGYREGWKAGYCTSDHANETLCAGRDK